MDSRDGGEGGMSLESSHLEHFPPSYRGKCHSFGCHFALPPLWFWYSRNYGVRLMGVESPSQEVFRRHMDVVLGGCGIV